MDGPAVVGGSGNLEQVAGPRHVALLFFLRLDDGYTFIGFLAKKAVALLRMSRSSRESAILFAEPAELLSFGGREPRDGRCRCRLGAPNPELGGLGQVHLSGDGASTVLPLLRTSSTTSALELCGGSAAYAVAAPSFHWSSGHPFWGIAPYSGCPSNRVKPTPRRQGGHRAGRSAPVRSVVGRSGRGRAA